MVPRSSAARSRRHSSRSSHSAARPIRTSALAIAGATTTGLIGFTGGKLVHGETYYEDAIAALKLELSQRFAADSGAFAYGEAKEPWMEAAVKRVEAYRGGQAS